MKKNAKFYFREYLKIAPFSHAIWRSLEAQAVISRKITPPVLDIGCGFGEFAGVTFDKFVDMGIDISNFDLKIALRRKKYKNLLLADARNMPFSDNSFNTVLSVSTLEHIKGVQKVFPEVYRILTCGGQFIFTVPTRTLDNQLCLFPAKIIHKAFKHRSIFTKDKWLEMAKNSGFIIEHSEAIITPHQIHLFELGLPFALQSQITKRIFKKRLLFSPKIRTKIISALFSDYLLDNNKVDANILVVVKKPK